MALTPARDYDGGMAQAINDEPEPVTEHSKTNTDEYAALLTNLVDDRRATWVGPCLD